MFCESDPASAKESRHKGAGRTSGRKDRFVCWLFLPVALTERHCRTNEGIAVSNLSHCKFLIELQKMLFWLLEPEAWKKSWRREDDGKGCKREGKLQEELVSCAVDRPGVCLKQVDVVWPGYLQGPGWWRPSSLWCHPRWNKQLGQ